MTHRPTVSIQSLWWIPNFEKQTSITWSAHVLTYKALAKKVEQEIKVLLDMGSFGDNKINIVDQLQIEGIGDLSQLDAVIISHVHNDHLGNIIQLIKAWYTGLVYMSHTSKAIIQPILYDMLALASVEHDLIISKNTKFGIKADKMLSLVESYEKDKHWYEKSHHKHAKQKKQKEVTEEEYLRAKEFLKKYNINYNSDIVKSYLPVPDLPFEEEDIIQFLSQIRSFDKEEDYPLVTKEWLKLRAKFYEAGHIPWAVQTILKFGYDPYNSGAQHQLLYTWDLGRLKEPEIVPEPSLVKEKVDLTLMESTYGNRIHQERGTDQERLIENITTAQDLFMLPAFSLGRGPEVVKLLIDAIDIGTLVLWEWEKIFVDGKLTKEIAMRLLERDPQTYKFLTHPAIKFIDSTHHRKQIYEQEWRKIVIASGGMMQWWSSVPIANKYMSDKNAVFSTVGYQAYGTWGNYLQNNKGLVYTADRFKQMKNKIYHHEYTIEKIINREAQEAILISGQGTKELITILGDLYKLFTTHKYREHIQLQDDEYIYIPQRFWEDERRGSSTIKKAESFLKKYDTEVYHYFYDKIKIIDEDTDYDDDKKYIPTWPGIHIFWDLIGKKYMNSKMDHYSSFSGHADRDELIALLEWNRQKKNHTTILVHGEMPARKELSEHIQKNRLIPNKTILPELYDVLTFDCETGKLIEHKKEE